MNLFDIALLLCTILIVVLAILGIREAVLREREARSSSNRPRRIIATYSGFLGWEEEWEWEDVPPPVHVQMRRMTVHMHHWQEQIVLEFLPAMVRARQKMEELVEH